MLLVYESVCKAQSFMPTGLALGLPLLVQRLNEQGPSLVDSGPWVHRILVPGPVWSVDPRHQFRVEGPGF